MLYCFALCLEEQYTMYFNKLFAGLQVWPNIWHLCHDPEVWDEPWTFKPERFLDENGEFLPADHPARKQ